MKKNFPLIFGISIPLLMIIAIAASIYLPTLFTKPGYNFLYISGGDYYYRNEYTVENSKLVKKNITLPNSNYTSIGGESILYIHDTEKNTNNQITLEEAQNLTLSSNQESPDGFQIDQGGGGGGFFPFFFMSDSDYGSRYIKGHGVSKKLNLRSKPGSYLDFQFLGWVEK